MQGRSGMVGVITSGDVLRHAVTIVREFGPSAYARCVVALVTGRPRTFLAAIQAPAPSSTHPFRRSVVAFGVVTLLVGAVSLAFTSSALTDPSCSTACLRSVDG